MAMNELLPRIDKMIYLMRHEYSGGDVGVWDEEIKLLMDCREMLVKLFMLPAENDNGS
jgi:hypothetical protein